MLDMGISVKSNPKNTGFIDSFKIITYIVYKNYLKKRKVLRFSFSSGLWILQRTFRNAMLNFNVVWSGLP